MKTIFNHIIPVKGFFAINLFGTMFVRKEYKPYFDESASVAEKLFVKKTYTHESIHTEQQKETLFIGFYIMYVLEWLIKLIISMFMSSDAYMSISFEQEAYDNENNEDYINERKRFTWIKHIFSMKK